MQNAKRTIGIARWRRARAVHIAALLLVAWVPRALAQQDLCGCQGSPRSLGAFDGADDTTLPPGATSGFRVRTFPVPPDGVLVFDSFHMRPRPEESCCVGVTFTGNDANTPVTILVAGDFTFEGGGSFISVRGNDGRTGVNGAAGLGGLGGPGSYRGGDAAYQAGNQASNGGEGFGPGGGTAATAAPFAGGGGGSFSGTPELRPLIGGSGGGGGASTAAGATCAGGGGGGGGGAILIVANGTITIGDNTQIVADGGNGGPPNDGSCSSGGGGGSGGAIRLVAQHILSVGNALLFARGGSPNGAPGRIRFETPLDEFRVDGTTPVALRTLVPAAIVDPLAPSVAIATVGGQAVPIPPQGARGGIDVFLSTPGLVSVGLASSGVPGGTLVDVRAKPRLGGAGTTNSATLGSCSGAGACSASTVFDLSAGAWVLEALATFHTP